MQGKTTTILVLFLLCISFLNVSCTTTKNNTALGIARDEQNAFQAANRYFREEQYQRAMLKYSAYIYAPPQQKKYMDEARYRLALTHFLMNQYHEALVTADELIRGYPDSQWVDEAQELIEKSKTQIARSEEVHNQREQAIYQEIATLESQLISNQNDTETYMKLADLYWGIGNHPRAIQYYEQAAQINPDTLNNSRLKERVRISPTGEFTLREPMMEFYTDEVVKITQASLDNVVLKDNWLGRDEGMRYSGSVENTGLYDVNNVQIEASIYDSFNRIMDTRVEHIGTIRAGGKRPFSIIFNLFNELHVNVSKVETEVYYDKL